MSRDVRELLHSAAATPRRPLDTAAVLGRSRSIARRRVAFAAVALVPAVAAVALVRLPDAPANVVAAPRSPGVAFERLDDGTRVYVVRHADDTVTVLDAVSTHRPGGASKQVGWCPGSGFEDPQHGSRWDERGVYVFGPAPSDLPYYRVRPHGDGLAVGERVERPTRGDGRPTGTPCADGERARALVLWDGAGGGEDRTYGSVADLPEGRYGRVVAEAHVTARGTRLCDPGGSPCLDYAGQTAPGGDVLLRGTFLARREGGVLADVVSVEVTAG